MPLGWSIFGNQDGDKPPSSLPPNVHRLENSTDDVEGDTTSLDAIKETLSNDGEVIKGGTFPSINGASRSMPAEAQSTPAPSHGAEAWSTIEFKRNDSAASMEMSGGDFPSIVNVNVTAPAISSPVAMRNSIPSRGRPGLPPPAPRSPLALAFSRRGGRPSNNANIVGKGGSPTASPKARRSAASMLPGAGAGGGDSSGVGSQIDAAAYDAAASAADPDSIAVGAGLPASCIGAGSSKHALEVSTNTFSRKNNSRMGPMDRSYEDATVSVTAPPSSTSSPSLGPSSFSASLSHKQPTTGLGGEDAFFKRSTVGAKGVDASSGEQQWRGATPKSRESHRSSHQRTPSAVNPLTESQLAPFEQTSSRMSSSWSLSGSERLPAGFSPANAGAKLKEANTGSATAYASTKDRSTKSHNPRGAPQPDHTAALPNVRTARAASNPPAVSSSRGQGPIMDAPSSANAGAALGQPWGGGTPRLSSAKDVLGTADVASGDSVGGGGDAVAGVFDPSNGGSAGLGEVDETGANTRDSSQRGSSFVMSNKALSGLSLRGCLPRRSQPPPEQPNIRALPTHPSFRGPVPPSKSATPKASPKVTPGRFRTKKRSSFRRQQSQPQDGRASPVRVVDLPPPASRRSGCIANGVGKTGALTGARRHGAAVVSASDEAEMKDALAAEATGRVEEQATTAEVRVRASEGEDVKESEAEEEKEPEEPEAVVAESVRMVGLLECGRAVRMDGNFKGQLVSSGSITVGSTGQITGDLKGIEFLRVEGQVIGDVVCNTVMVLEEGKIYGDITAVKLTLGPNTTVRGMLNVVDDASCLKEALEKSAKAPASAEDYGDDSAAESAGAEPKARSRESVSADLEEKVDNGERDFEEEKQPEMTSEPGCTERGGNGHEETFAKLGVTENQIWSDDEDDDLEPMGDDRSGAISPEKLQEVDSKLEMLVGTEVENQHEIDTQPERSASVVQVTMYEQVTKDVAAMASTASDTDIASDKEGTPTDLRKTRLSSATTAEMATKKPARSSPPAAPDAAAPASPEASRKRRPAQGVSPFSKHGLVDDESIHMLSEEYSSGCSLDASSGDDAM